MIKQSDNPSLKIEEISLVNGSCSYSEVLLHINNVHVATVKYIYEDQISEIFIKLTDAHFADNYHQVAIDTIGIGEGVKEAKKIISQWFAVLGIEVS